MFKLHISYKGGSRTFNCVNRRHIAFIIKALRETRWKRIRQGWYMTRSDGRKFFFHPYWTPDSKAGTFDWIATQNIQITATNSDDIIIFDKYQPRYLRH